MSEASLFFKEANMYLESMQDISLVDFMFEEEVVDNNEVASTGAINAIKNAFKAIRNMIAEIIQKIKDFFKFQFLDADRKAKYKKFREMVKTNPELRDVKITFVNFEAYEKVYDEYIAKLEAEANKPNPSLEAAQAIMEGLKVRLGEVGDAAANISKRAALEVTIGAAIDIADRNTTAAKAINAALNSEEKILDELEKELGKKEAIKFKNKIEKLSKKGKIHQWITSLHHKKLNTLEGILKKQVGILTSYTNIDSDGKIKDGKAVVDRGSIIKGAISHPGFTKAVFGKDAAKDIRTINNAANDVKKTSKDVQKITKAVEKEIAKQASFMGIKK